MTHLTAYLIACPLALVLYALISARALYRLWVRYVFVMHCLKLREAGTLPKLAERLAYLPAGDGVAWDVFCNLAFVSFLGLEFPRWGEWTVTARLKRWHSLDDWRGDVARKVCPDLLDPFDPDGCHCGK